MMWIHDFAEFIQKRKVWGLVLKFADRLIYVKNPAYFLEWRMFYSMTISWKELCKKSNNFNIVFKTYSDFYFAWLIITEYHFIFPRCQVTSNSWKANLSLFFFKENTFQFHTLFMSYNPFMKYTIICQVFFLQFPLWFFVNYLSPQLDKKIKRNSYVQNLSCMWGVWVEAQNSRSFNFKPLIRIVNRCSKKADTFEPSPSLIGRCSKMSIEVNDFGTNC